MRCLAFRLLCPVFALSLALAAPAAESAAPAGEVVARFAGRAPAGWALAGSWQFSRSGGRADGPCTATSGAAMPADALVEVVVLLPDAAGLRRGARLEIGIGDVSVAVALTVGATDYRMVISGRDTDGKDQQRQAAGDTRPAVAGSLGQADKHAGWAERTVVLGLQDTGKGCRALLDGSEVASAPARAAGRRTVRLHAEGVTVCSVRVRSGVADDPVGVSGAGIALLSGGLDSAPARLVVPATPATVEVRAGGATFRVLVGGARRIAVFDVGAERWEGRDWSEGVGMPMAPVPPRAYSAAHVLLYRPDHRPDRVAAMGIGLRPPERSAGELRNIVIGEADGVRSSTGVTVRRAPDLGPGWYVACVPLNPATLYWYTHDRDGHPVDRHGPAAFSLYVTRPWTAGGGTPHPDGGRSALQVAAVTLEEAGIDLCVKGNGLGNVYLEPDTPRLSATLRNATPVTLDATVTCELIPLERPRLVVRRLLRLEPGGEATVDALTAAVRERGHYRVRVVADAGRAGRIEWRTNAALLAADTRRKENSPFGCWAKLWGDEATDAQRDYLKRAAGVGFLMGKHNFDVRLNEPIPDDVAAEAIVRRMGPEVRVLMLGWEQTWSPEQTFAFPRVILEGDPEALPADVARQADEAAERWRRLARAARRLRPDVRISLGNSAVNFAVPFLERGFRPGVEFDLFGTEEGLFWASPEQPADAIGNVSWWARAVCEHFGFRDVPQFHSETVYYATGPGFSAMDERRQAALYARTYLLGFPFRSLFGLSGAIVDSGNQYVYSNWGTAGYCNQAPECSPKLSFVTYATLTRQLDGARYVGRLETGTTTVYALRFARPDGEPLTVMWNLRGRRAVTLRLGDGNATVTDALDRAVPVTAGRAMPLILGELPVYVAGAAVTAVEPGRNVPEPLPGGTLLAPLTDLASWAIDKQPDLAFEAPREWRGVPKVTGRFTVGRRPDLTPPGLQVGAVTFTLHPDPRPHGLLPRYVSLSALAAGAIPIPAGTTELGLWVRGAGTWAQAKLGLEEPDGRRWLALDEDSTGRMADNFDGWRFLRTGPLSEAVRRGGGRVSRFVVTMPAQQVYVDTLVTPLTHEIAVAGLTALRASAPEVNYLPW